MTLKQGRRIINITWTYLLVLIPLKGDKNSLWFTSAFHEGRCAQGKKTGKKTNKKKINHFYIHRMCYMSSLHLSGGHSVHAGRTWKGFTNHIILFSVRCGGQRANAFLIWRLWGWSQELIVSWSGAPEPIVLEGIKVPPPAGLLSHTGACARVELTCPGNAIENRSPPAHTCWSSVPNPDPEVEQQAKRETDEIWQKKITQFTFGMLIC